MDITISAADVVITGDKPMPTIEHRGYLLHYQSNTGETVRQAPNGSVKVFASLRAAKLSVTKLTKDKNDESTGSRCNQSK